MYHRDKPITLKSSASALCNNLDVLANPERGVINYAVVHKAIVNIITSSTDGSNVTNRQVFCKEPSAAQGNASILEAKWVTLRYRTVLVLTSHKGIQLYEADGSIMLYWHAIGNVDSDEATFASGITGIGEDLLCIGIYTGEIMVFSVSPRGTNINLSETLKGSQPSAVCALASEGDNLIASDDEGGITLWSYVNDRFRRMARISGAGSPCNSIDIWNGIIVGGYGSGHIRIFDLSSGKMMAEVTAHARGINSVHIAKDSGKLVSAGDDTFVRVWQLNKDSRQVIEHLHSQSVTDVQLVGARAVEDTGRAFCITGYDHNEIIFLKEG